ncbi:MAG: hypothetical protein ACFFCM_12335 [Promethearchaeota archaeon]
MPYIVVTAWYPSDLAKTVAEKYFEMLKKMPFDRSLGKETIPVAVTTNKRGIKVLSVMEVKQGKLEDAIAWVGKRMAMFIDIKGYEYSERIWSTVIEALDSIGMSLPG